jgi:hypothetical protein
LFGGSYAFAEPLLDIVAFADVSVHFANVSHSLGEVLNCSFVSSTFFFFQWRKSVSTGGSHHTHTNTKVLPWVNGGEEKLMAPRGQLQKG